MLLTTYGTLFTRIRNFFAGCGSKGTAIMEVVKNRKLSALNECGSAILDLCVEKIKVVT
jgi:hypothetical protein